MSKATHYADGAMILDGDDLACGGGKSCTSTDGLCWGTAYVVAGRLRCTDCAVRLGWIPNGDSYEQRRAFRWAHSGTRPAWIGEPINR